MLQQRPAEPFQVMSADEEETDMGICGRSTSDPERIWGSIAKLAASCSERKPHFARYAWREFIYS